MLYRTLQYRISTPQIKRLFKIHIFLFLILFTTGCKREDTVGIKFPETVSLAATHNPEIPDIFMKYPYRVRVQNQNLYIMDLHAEEYYCHQFTYPEMEYVQSYAKRGEGAGEFLDTENIRLDSSSTLWMLDSRRHKMISFNQDSTKENKYADSIQKEIELSASLIRSVDFVLYNDSTFIVPDYTGNYRFCFVNAKGEIEKECFDIPSKKSDSMIPGTALAQAWRSFLDYNPENNILAIGTQLGAVIDIYNLKEQERVNIIYGKEGEPKFKMSGGYAIPDGIMGYSDIFVGKEQIYAVFWGYSMKDKAAGIIEHQGGKEIHVFDLQGNPVRKYELDRYIVGFDIDEENGKLIALDISSDKPVVEYKF